MTKTAFDLYLEEQMKKPGFRRLFERARRKIDQASKLLGAAGRSGVKKK